MLDEAARGALRDEIRAAAATGDAWAVLSGVRQLLAGSQKLTGDASFAVTALEKVSDAVVLGGQLRRLRTYLVRSVTVEPLLPMLKAEAVLQGFLLELELGGYGSWIDDLTNKAGALARSKPDLVLVVLDLEDVAGNLPDLCAAGEAEAVQAEVGAITARLQQLLQALRGHSAARVLLQGFVVPDHSATGDVGDANLITSLPYAVAQVNRELAAVCRGLGDCVFYDVDRIAARRGRARWRDHRLFLSTRLGVAGENFPAYAKALMRSALTLFRAPKKVLCTDLDNTLWGGILGEDGPGGIATGSAFPGNGYGEYQRYLKQLAGRGVLLAAVSKNNPGDVEEAFRLRAADLALTLDDFVATKIGWGEKVDSLRQLAADLSLGLDSFVFVDDSPVECEAVRQQLPEVAVVPAPVHEPWRMGELLASEPFFDSAQITADDHRRAGEYRAQAMRAELASAMGSSESFLASLNIVCTVLPAREAPLARAVQLLGKTNQFNLTTRRHGAAEVERFAETGIALAIRVRDRFGDAGVVGLALAELEGETCRIDSFLLSCRVIGRGIEGALLAEVAAQARSAGASRLVGEYMPTAKNSLCATFYPDHGFAACASTSPGSLAYALDLPSASLRSPTWLTLEGSVEDELATYTVVAS